MIPSEVAQASFSRTKVTVYAVAHGELLLKSSTDDSKRCASDPDVQAAVATISMMMTMMLGILTCLTTGWWGSVRLRPSLVLVIVLISDVAFRSLWPYPNTIVRSFRAHDIGRQLPGSGVLSPEIARGLHVPTFRRFHGWPIRR